jgi:Flp pilus assembly protein RcpC/CpaB
MKMATARRMPSSSRSCWHFPRGRNRRRGPSQRLETSRDNCQGSRKLDRCRGGALGVWHRAHRRQCQRGFVGIIDRSRRRVQVESVSFEGRHAGGSNFDERNEPVLSSRITGPNQSASLAALTEPGMRAVSIRVDEARGVAGFVRMGDRVNVILTTSDSKDKPSRSHADILLQGVKVLATGQIANDRQDHPTVVPTVTVEVSTEQAQKLILAESVGTLSLVLRQAGDADPEAVRRITMADIGESEPAAAPAPSRLAEVWIYRGDAEPISREVYRESHLQAR